MSAGENLLRQKEERLKMLENTFANDLVSYWLVLAKITAFICHMHSSFPSFTSHLLPSSNELCLGNLLTSLSKFENLTF